MARRRRKKPGEVLMRFRKNDPPHNLLAAVQRYVRSTGGAIVVIGGIEIQEWGESEHHFRVAVRCLGRKPTKPEETPAGGQPASSRPKKKRASS